MNAKIAGVVIVPDLHRIPGRDAGARIGSECPNTAPGAARAGGSDRSSRSSGSARGAGRSAGTRARSYGPAARSRSAGAARACLREVALVIARLTGSGANQANNHEPRGQSRLRILHARSTPFEEKARFSNGSRAWPASSLTLHRAAARSGRHARHAPHSNPTEPTVRRRAAGRYSAALECCVSGGDRSS